MHKKGIPLRPIVSCIQSLFYKLSKYLASCLKPIIGLNDFYIKDSWHFKEFIEQVEINPNFKLVSFDVTSLYTNIPIELVERIIRNKWTLICKYTKLPLKEFLRATELCLTLTYFQFKDLFYKQTFGCAMGSPISSVIAQLVLEDLEENIIKNYDHKINFYKRYVDDCITAIDETFINDFLSQLNSYHPKLQFTFEMEKNNSINFLDLTLIKKNNKILTQWYTKDVWSGRYSNFNSTQPFSHKVGVITSLIDRAIKLTSPELRPIALQKAKNTLVNNGYPSLLINKICKKRIHLSYNRVNTVKTKEQINYIKMPYIKHLSEKINHILRPHNFVIAHQNKNNFKKLFFTRLKPKQPINKISHVVYKINCKGCDGIYIGETMQLLGDRINGHKYSKNSTALKKHQNSTKHDFDFENVTILHQEQNDRARNVLEMIEVHKNKQALNDRTDIQFLNKSYNLII